MTAIYWRNLEKRWQNGETESQKNGGVRQAHPPKIFIWITAWKSGCKDSGMEGGKKMLCLGIFSTRHKHTKNLCLWNSSVFGVCWEYWNGWSNFANDLVYFFKWNSRNANAFSSACNTAVRGDESDCIASILRLRSGTNKQQYSGCRNWINPETLCTIFLHPIKGWRGIVGFRLGNWPCKL